MIEPNPVRLNSKKSCTEYRNYRKGRQSGRKGKIGGRGVDVTIVACSVGSARWMLRILSQNAEELACLVGFPASTGFVDSNIIHYKEVGVFGLRIDGCKTKSSSADCRQKIEVGKYISGKYEIKDIMQAFDDIRKR